MSIYSVKNKGLTWRISHLSVHYKRFKDSDASRWPLRGLRYIWKGNDKEIHDDVKEGEDEW